jgi:hypothetical protein
LPESISPNPTWWWSDCKLEECGPWEHRSWCGCAKNSILVSCNEVWKPVYNSKYISSKIFIHWDEWKQMYSTAWNCDWICLNWYWWPDCSIEPNWEITNEWWECSKDCWWWVQEKVVKCVNYDWWRVADKFCERTSQKPTVSQSCNTQVCVYDWKCWPAARDYLYWDNWFNQGLCSVWTVTWWVIPTFPQVGTEVTWTCDWVSWWATSASCKAYRKTLEESQVKVNWACWSAAW